MVDVQSQSAMLVCTAFMLCVMPKRLSNAIRPLSFCFYCRATRTTNCLCCAYHSAFAHLFERQTENWRERQSVEQRYRTSFLYFKNCCSRWRDTTVRATTSSSFYVTKDQHLLFPYNFYCPPHLSASPPLCSWSNRKRPPSRSEGTSTSGLNSAPCRAPSTHRERRVSLRRATRRRTSTGTRRGRYRTGRENSTICRSASFCVPIF